MFYRIPITDPSVERFLATLEETHLLKLDYFLSDSGLMLVLLTASESEFRLALALHGARLTAVQNEEVADGVTLTDALITIPDRPR